MLPTSETISAALRPYLSASSGSQRFESAIAPAVAEKSNPTFAIGCGAARRRQRRAAVGLAKRSADGGTTRGGRFGGRRAGGGRAKGWGEGGRSAMRGRDARRANLIERVRTAREDRQHKRFARLVDEDDKEDKADGLLLLREREAPAAPMVCRSHDLARVPDQYHTVTARW